MFIDGVQKSVIFNDKSIDLQTAESTGGEFCQMGLIDSQTIQLIW